ncbi:uncharacterized protein LAJ45_00955 [Morchella importuna]|uniref:uncharacterized protein n=1 Tax=Morchella importuna TaxID=1174673 RepID=UPI001E8D6A13|nr:uncharacterized protein LAJ45_00955 [Morchella importuna]KAH8154428.1 hypothetical protein LAJ45_00955 [Morchella importuna]
MHNQLLALTSRYLFPEVELNEQAVRLVLGDISAFFSVLLLVHSGIFIFKKIRGPANSIPAFRLFTADEARPIPPPLPVVPYRPDTFIPVVPDEEEEDEDYAWDAAFYRAHIGDPGNYFLDYSMDAVTPPRSDSSGGDSDLLPPPERPSFTRLVQAGGVFRALRGNSTWGSVSSHTTSSARSVTAWPDSGLVQETFEDPEMDRIAARLVDLSVTPGDVLAALQLTYPDLRIEPVGADESDERGVNVESPGLPDADMMDVDVRVTGLDLAGVEENDQVELVEILRTLYRLKLFVDEKRQDENSRSGSSGEEEKRGPTSRLDAMNSGSNSRDHAGDGQPNLDGGEATRGSGSGSDQIPALSKWSTDIDELFMLAYNG